MEKVEPAKVHALASSMPWRRRSGRGSGLWKLYPAFTQYIILLGRALLEPGRCRLHYQSPLTEELLYMMNWREKLLTHVLRMELSIQF